VRADKPLRSAVVQVEAPLTVFTITATLSVEGGDDV
jgi:hypothetical protein